MSKILLMALFLLHFGACGGVEPCSHDSQKECVALVSDCYYGGRDMVVECMPEYCKCLYNIGCRQDYDHMGEGGCVLIEGTRW